MTPNLTTTQAAERLNVSPRRVRQLLKANRLLGACKFSGVWMIPAKALAAVAGRKTGRPRSKAPVVFEVT